MTIKVIQGDITKIKVDAIVNAANTSLLGGSGVDGAIHRAAGKTLLDECQKIRNRQGGCKVGQAVITGAGKLNAKFVIHAVGPIWNNGKSEEVSLLNSAYYQCLLLAMEYHIKFIAFPNISTGSYKFPKTLAAQIAISTVTNFLKQTTKIKEVIFVCFDDENYKIYNSIINY